MQPTSGVFRISERGLISLLLSFLPLLSPSSLPSHFLLPLIPFLFSLHPLIFSPFLSFPSLPPSSTSLSLPFRPYFLLKPHFFHSLPLPNFSFPSPPPLPIITARGSGTAKRILVQFTAQNGQICKLYPRAQNVHATFL